MARIDSAVRAEESAHLRGIQTNPSQKGSVVINVQTSSKTITISRMAVDRLTGLMIERTNLLALVDLAIRFTEAPESSNRKSLRDTISDLRTEWQSSSILRLRPFLLLRLLLTLGETASLIHCPRGIVRRSFPDKTNATTTVGTVPAPVRMMII